MPFFTILDENAIDFMLFCILVSGLFLSFQIVFGFVIWVL